MVLAVQLEAVRAQIAAHAKYGVERGQALDALAQYIVCSRDGAFLPNATGEGLTVLLGTERMPLDELTVKQYAAKAAETGDFTPAEIAEAVARLDANIAAGVTLDPKTAENVDPRDYA